MFKKLLLFLVCLWIFFAPKAFGQDVQYKELIFFPVEGFNSYKSAVAFRDNYKNRKYFIYEIIDNRKVKDRVGVFYKNNKTYRYYKFPMTLDLEMKNYFILAGATYSGAGKDSIKLEIEQFEYLKNKSEIQDKGSIHLSFSFLSTNNEVLYRYNYDLENKTYLVNENPSIAFMQNAILNALYVFNYVGEDYIPDSIGTKDISSYADIFKTKPHKGFYVTLDELINNNPSIRPEFDINKAKDPEDYHKWEIVFRDSLLEADKATFFKNVIGFSDGEDMYVSALNYATRFAFNPVLEKGRYLFFQGRSTSSLDNGVDGAGIDYASYYMMSFYFGLAGGLAMAALSAIPADYDAIIDLKTGKLYIVDDDFLDKIITTNLEVKDTFATNPKRYETNMKRLIFRELNKEY